MSEFGKSMNKYNLEFIKTSTPNELRDILNKLPFEYDIIAIYPAGLKHVAWIHSVRSIKKVPLRDVVEAPIKEEGLVTENSSVQKPDRKTNSKRKV